MGHTCERMRVYVGGLGATATQQANYNACIAAFPNSPQACAALLNPPVITSCPTGWTWNGTVCVQTDPTVYVNPPAPVQAPSTPPPVATYTPRVSLKDSTSGSSLSGGMGVTGFFVGDSFTLSISGGAPNAPVAVVRAAGNWIAGSTDAGGNFTTTGLWAPEDAGAWAQQWLVGNDTVQPSPLNFVVQVAPGTPAPAGTTSTVGTGASTGNSGSVTEQPAGSISPLLLVGAAIAAYFAFGSKI